MFVYGFILCFYFTYFSVLCESRVNIGFGWNGYGVFGVGDRKSHSGKVLVGVGDPFKFLQRPFQMIISGYRHSFIKANGSLYGFGTDHNCVLGYTQDKYQKQNIYPFPREKIQLSKEGHEIIRLSSSWSHTVALTSTGSVFVWGETSGQFGVPVDEWGTMCKPLKIFSNGSAISVGLCHTLVVLKNGSVFGQGCNDHHEIQSNNISRFADFTSIPFPENVKIIDVSAGNTFSIYLSDDGRVFWNGAFNCYNCRKGPRLLEAVMPVEMFDSKIYGKVGQIHSGFFHALLVLGNGSVLGVGKNSYGCLGERDVVLIDPSYPKYIDVSPMNLGKGEKIVKVVPMDASSLYLTSLGRVFYMGQNLSTSILINDGKGSGSILHPTEISKGIDDFIVDVDASGNHINAISKNSSYCWGDNRFYQCSVTPRKRIRNFEKATCDEFEKFEISKIVLAFEHGIGIASDGTVYSFGINSFGELGYGDFENHFFPVNLDTYNHRIVSGDVSSQTGLLVDDRGQIFVFGSGDGISFSLDVYAGNLGQAPHLVDWKHFDGRLVRKVITSGDHAHVLTRDGYLYSWGDGEEGELGMGRGILFSNFPLVMNSSILGKVKRLAAGTEYILAVNEDDLLYQWGNRIYYPERVEGFPDSCEITVIEAGEDWNLAVVDDFNIYIWGKVGTPNHLPATNYDLPVHYWTAPKRIVQCVTQYHTICILQDGSVYGMGNNEWNQLLLGEDVKFVRNFTQIKIYDDEKNIMKFSSAALSAYSTVLQEYISCNGVLDSDIDVCVSHGVCTSGGCNCFYGYTGIRCDVFSCDGISAISRGVCHDHGKCSGPGICDCNKGWSNFNSSSNPRDSDNGFCAFPVCAVDDQSGKICGGRGLCEVVDGVPKCMCNDKYRGDVCQYPVCNGASNSKKNEDNCGWKANCVSPNFCQCFLDGLNELYPYQSGNSGEGCVISPLKVLFYVFLAIFSSCCLCCFCSIFCAVSLLCCTSGSFCCSVCCCIGTGSLTYSSTKTIKSNIKERKQSNLEKAGEKFNTYPEISTLLDGSINSDSTGSIDEQVVISLESEDEDEGEESEKEDEQVKESTGLLQNKMRNGLTLGENHLFKGDINGEGTIYYFRSEQKHKKDKDLYPVFRGIFKNGKKEGFGKEYRYHEISNPHENDVFWYDKRKISYSGNFRENHREGMGTQFDEDGKPVRIGEWRSGMIFRVHSIDFRLPIIDIRSDVEWKEEIGRGGFSTIFRGKYNRKDVAVKVYCKDFVLCDSNENVDLLEDQQEKTGSRFIWKKKEAEINDMDSRFESVDYQISPNRLLLISKIKSGIHQIGMFPHPHVVKIIAWSGFQIEEENFGYILELCKESVLSRWEEKNEIGETIEKKEKLRILYEIALGMRHLHNTCGMIHRDLKFANTLLDHLDKVKICDFDLSNRSELDFSGSLNSEHPAGSTFYVAPECLKCTFDRSCDVFSYGIMLFELLFDKVGDPYSLRKLGKCPVCDEEVEKVKGKGLLKWLVHHYENCGFRPIMEKKKDKDIQLKAEGLKWQVKLMKRCWIRNYKQRPSFSEIVQIFEEKSSKESKRKSKLVVDVTGYGSVNNI